jgi:hypothetical protein
MHFSRGVLKRELQGVKYGFKTLSCHVVQIQVSTGVTAILSTSSRSDTAADGATVDDETQQKQMDMDTGLPSEQVSMIIILFLSSYYWRATLKICLKIKLTP